MSTTDELVRALVYGHAVGWRQGEEPVPVPPRHRWAGWAEGLPPVHDVDLTVASPAPLERWHATLEVARWLAEATDDPAELAGRGQVVEPVVGVRLWRHPAWPLDPLPSLFSPERWPQAGVVRARCHLGHAAPAPGCLCGLSAWGGPGGCGVLLRELYFDGPPPGLAGTRPLGLAALSGRVIVAEAGFRAERGRVLLWVDFTCNSCTGERPCPRGGPPGGAVRLCWRRARHLARRGVPARAVV